MNSEQPKTTIEFAVEKLDETIENVIQKNLEGYGDLNIDKEKGRLVIKSAHPWIEIKDRIEITGRRAVLTGFGNQSAVVTINNNDMKGVVRFTVADGEESGCAIDGVLDGLGNKQYSINIHEFGDFSQGCDSVGDVLKIDNTLVGNLGTISSDTNGRAAFKFKSESLSVPNIIGRSFVVKSIQDHNIISCGMIARSAGILQNYKKFCACDGISLWDEQNKPNKL